MHSELSCGIRCRGPETTPRSLTLPADDHRLAFQRWIEQFLHRDEERIHVDDGKMVREKAGMSEAAAMIGEILAAALSSERP